MANPTKTRETIPDIFETSGEIFVDGSVVEVVSSAPDHRLDLLFWNGKRTIVAPQIEYRNHIYQPPTMDETLRRAIRFPGGADDYGSAKKLFAELQILFERYIGFAARESSLMSAWVCSTWLADCISSPPTLTISGSEMGRALTFFRLLSCLCRRSLMVADINRNAFLSVMKLHPTLLISQPSASPKMLTLWNVSNHRGVFVVGGQG